MKTELKIRVDLYFPLHEEVCIDCIEESSIHELVTKILKCDISNVNEYIKNKSNLDEELPSQIYDILKNKRSHEMQIKMHLYIPVENELTNDEAIYLGEEIICEMLNQTKNTFKDDDVFDVDDIQYSLKTSEIEVFE